MALRIPLVAFACLSAFNIPSLFAGESELLPPAQYFYQAAKNLGGKTEINDGQVTIWNDNLIILELGADVNGAPDVDPVFASTPLELAIDKGWDEIADMLRAAGATE